MDARDLFSECFLSEEEAGKALASFLRVRGERGATLGEQRLLLAHVARIRFEQTTLETMLDGDVEMDLTPDGRILWVQTAQGRESAIAEREGLGLPPKE